MKRDETVNMLLMLQRAYPLFYGHKSQRDMSAIAELWHKHVGKFEYDIVTRAVTMLIDNETAVPTIALLKKYILQAEESYKQEYKDKMQDMDVLNRLAK